MNQEETIKKETSEVGTQIEKMSKFLNNINFSKFISNWQQAFNKVKKNIEKLMNSNIGTTIALAINTEDAQKQVSQIEKELQSLQKKIEARYFCGMEF